MQFGATILFLLMAYAAAAENACPPTEVVKFAELYANPHLHPCQKASAGFSLAPPMGYPTEQQVKAMCSSDACHELIKDVLDLKPDDCYLSFGSVKLNAYKLAYSFEDTCKADKNHESGKDEPTPKPTDDKHHPAPKPTEDKHYPTPKPTDGKYHPTSKPTEDDKHYTTPKPNEDQHHPTPRPTDDKHHPAPKPTEEKDYPTPKPTDGKYHPTPKPTEDDKHYSTPKPTEDKHYPTPKPTDEKYHPTPTPTEVEHYEPMIIKVDNEETSCPKHCAVKENAKEADVKPPMKGTADELFPMPNTTYKATEPKTSPEA